MEQATTGKVPPQIAIPGGGIMLNMNAVQRSVGMGATVVPTPASAQTAVVGSPQVPGKPQPRVISITPQMMRQQAPGGVSFTNTLKYIWISIHKYPIYILKKTLIDQF